MNEAALATAVWIFWPAIVIFVVVNVIAAAICSEEGSRFPGNYFRICFGLSCVFVAFMLTVGILVSVSQATH